MARQRKGPAEGTWFGVPLKDGGFAVGLAARSNRKGLCLGYFFGPRSALVPTLDQVRQLRPGQAMWVEQFGDLGLIRDEWPVIGLEPEWERKTWPVPPFVRYDEIGRTALEVLYDDDLSCVSEQPCDPNLRHVLPEDGLAGYQSVELLLNRMLAEPKQGRTARVHDGE